MDWFSWLSRTNLDPTITYEYALAFAHNELDDEDIPYLDHAFLQSMGISIAKHRLEILKLATAENKKNKRVARRPVLWLKLAVKQTKSYLIKKMEALVHINRRRENNSPLSLFPHNKRNNSMRWKVAMLQRNKRLKTPLAKPSINWPNAITNDDYDDDGGGGGHRFVSRVNGTMTKLIEGNPDQSSGSTGSSGWAESEVNGEESGNQWNSSFSKTVGSLSGDGESWSKSTEDHVKWDSLFKSLKPT